VWDTLVIAFETGWAILKTAVDTATALFKGDWETVWDGVKTIFRLFFVGLWAIARTMFTTLWRIFKDKAIWIKDEFIKQLKKLNEYIKSGDIAKDILNAVNGIGEDLMDVGRKIAEWIWDGLRDKMPDVWEWFKGELADIKNWLFGTGFDPTINGYGANKFSEEVQTRLNGQGATFGSGPVWTGNGWAVTTNNYEFNVTNPNPNAAVDTIREHVRDHGSNEAHPLNPP
jgi:hypothetical protein